MKRVLAFAGGKGGTGKSSLALSFAERYSRLGSTVIIDLDLGAANIHTMLGIHTPEKGISEFLFNNQENRPLSDYVLDTHIDNLKFITSNSIIQGTANIEYQRKLKIINGIKQLNFETVILDIGAGSNYNSIDFFDEADYPIVVTTPDLTSIINAYEFLKNHLFRKFKKNIKPKTKASSLLVEAMKRGVNSFELIELYKTIGDNETASLIDRLCKDDVIYMIVNRAKSDSRTIGDKLRALSKQFLNIDLQYVDNINESNSFTKALIKGLPVTIVDSNIAEQIDRNLFL